MKADMKRLNQQRMKEELDYQRIEKVSTKKKEVDLDCHYYTISKDLLNQQSRRATDESQAKVSK
jgi:hypothetical protein